MFAENLVGSGFLSSVFYIKSIPTHQKLFAVGKSGPNATFNLILLGLGGPWVGKLVGFIIVFKCFPTQQKLVNRKHPDVVKGWNLGRYPSETGTMFLGQSRDARGVLPAYLILDFSLPIAVPVFDSKPNRCTRFWFLPYFVKNM